MVDVEKPEVDFRDEGKHAGRNDLLFVEDNVDVNSVTPHDLHWLLYTICVRHHLHTVICRLTHLC